MKMAGKKYTSLTVFLSLLTFSAFAEGPAKPSEMDNPLAVALVVIAGALLIAIITLGFVLTGAADIYIQRIKAEKKKAAEAAVKITTVLLLCCLSASSFGQDKPVEEAVKTTSSIGGLSVFSFYSLCTVIGLEVLVILVMAYYIKLFIVKEKILVDAAPKAAKTLQLKKIWQKMNNFKSQQEEEALVLAHDYDGIHELDNRLPRWWVYGFYFTILFGTVYIYRYHVSHTAPLPEEELQIAIHDAEIQKENYLKTAADKVDENTITLNADPSFVGDGQKLFSANCAPCHGDKGQGIVGPNLTDDYWLHNGNIKDIFKTIKYGYPEKGMKSWKDDFAPVQIAKIANYIKTLHGTNPPNAKEPQGELYKDDAVQSGKDSLNKQGKKNVEISKL